MLKTKKYLHSADRRKESAQKELDGLEHSIEMDHKYYLIRGEAFGHSSRSQQEAAVSKSSCRPTGFFSPSFRIVTSRMKQYAVTVVWSWDEIHKTVSFHYYFCFIDIFNYFANIIESVEIKAQIFSCGPSASILWVP